MKKTYQQPAIDVVVVETEGVMKPTSIFNLYDGKQGNVDGTPSDKSTINKDPNLEVDSKENLWGWEDDEY